MITDFEKDLLLLNTQLNNIKQNLRTEEGKQLLERILDKIWESKR